MIWLRLGKQFQTQVFMFSKGKITQTNKPPVSPFKKPSTELKTPLNNPNIQPQKIINNMIKDKALKPPPKKMAGSVTVQPEESLVFEKKIPVVTIMGHVDHGKTTLIDYFRKSNIAEKQDGGITQRIGAFRVKTEKGQVTFIDTPGHEAFVNMRQRGAKMTDLVILVVSAVEGVKQQTIQVIETIKKLELKVIVALNKMDLPQANPQEIQNELQKAGLKLEPNGGDIPVLHISAKTGMNVDLLWDLILEDTKDRKAPVDCFSEASVLEAFQDKQGLNTMTIIMERGKLKINSLIILGQDFFRIKSMKDDQGNYLQELLPGQAGQIQGVPFIPAPGEQIIEVENQKKATFIIEQKKKQFYEKSRNKDQAPQIKATKIKFERSRMGRKQKRAFCRGVQEVWMNKFQDQEQKLLTKIEEVEALPPSQDNTLILDELHEQLEKHKKYVFEYLKNTGESSDTMNFLLKFGDRGMEETILLQLQKLKPILEAETKVKLNLIKSDVGDVSIGDIQEARNCSAKIFTFGSGVSSEARSIMEDNEQLPHTHKLIHNLLKDLKQSLFAKKINSLKGKQRGRAEIAEMYTLKSKKGPIKVPGIRLTEGKIGKNMKCYIFRNKIPISEAYHITFLKSFKKQMYELKKGEEGTIGFSPEIDFEVEKGDQIVSFEE